jgi:ribonuclease R
LTHLEGKIGSVFHAIVVGVEDFGVFCRLVELPVEGLVHVTSLADDYYYLEMGTHTLVGRSSGRRHRLGDRIEVRIAHVDVDRRELDLVLSDLPLSRAHRTRPARDSSQTTGRKRTSTGSARQRAFQGDSERQPRRPLPGDQAPPRKQAGGKSKTGKKGKKRKR